VDSAPLAWHGNTFSPPDVGCHQGVGFLARHPRFREERSSSHVTCWQGNAADDSGKGGGNCTRSPISVSRFEDKNLRISALSPAAPQQRDTGTDLHDLASVDARLERLCAAWASLPEHVILAILALVDSAGVVEADRLQPLSRDPSDSRR
jgi:hypothetical protein